MMDEMYWFVILAALVLMAIAFPLLIYSIVVTALKNKKTRERPSTIGKVSNVKVYRREGEWIRVVVYDYIVDGIKRSIRKEERIYPLEDSQVLQRIEKGIKKITDEPIYYNPDDPEEGIIISKISTFNIVATSICGVSFVVMVYQLIVFRKEFLYAVAIGFILVIVLIIKEEITDKLAE